MHVISRKKLKEFWERHPETEHALRAWFKIVRSTRYRMWSELKTTFSDKVDKVGERVVFDVGGNKCRVITVIHFDRGKLYIREVLRHPAYDKGRWKNG
jgi:mRNA interferase HigB